MAEVMTAGHLPSFGAVAMISLVLWPGATANAGEPWDGPALAAPPAAVLQAATARSAPEHAAAEILLEDWLHEFDPQGRHRCTHRLVYRCLTEGGIKDWGWIGVEWSPWCEERPSIRARVITPDGTSHLLDPETLGEVPAGAFSPEIMTDRKALRAPLPAVRVGAVIEEEIVVREVQPAFRQGGVWEHFLVNPFPTRAMRFTIEAPTELPLRHEVRGSDAKPIRTEQNGRVRLVLEVQPPEKLTVPEPFLPPDLPAFPSVVFSTGKSWADVAAGYADLIQPHLDPEPVKPLVREVLGDATDRREVAARLLAKVQESVRFVAVQFGQSAIVPTRPKDTLALRYGDCKDQAALLAAMLRAAGQPAYVALLKAGYDSDVVPSLPGLGGFNHAVVFAPGSPPLWIDPTASGVPFGELPLTDQGRWALVADAGTKELLKIPREDHRNHSIARTFDLILSETGQGRVCETLTATGVYAQQERSIYAALGREKMAQSWKNAAQSNYLSQSLARFEYTPPQEIARPFEVKVEIADATVAQISNGEAVVVLAPDSLFEQLPLIFTMGRFFKAMDSPAGKASAELPEKPGAPPHGETSEAAAVSMERKSPLLLYSPHLCRLQYRITPPPGFAPRGVPEDQEKSFGPAAFGQQFQVKEGGIVEASFRFDTGPGAFTAAEFNALRRGIAELGEGNDSRWEIKIAFEHPGLKHLAEGRTKEALADFQKLLLQRPDQPEHRWHVSQALLLAGLGEAARQEARRAVELAPRSAPMHANLASVLSHDLLGRPFRPGMDRAGAAESYRKALEIAPSDWLTHASSAALLEHSADGRRYSAEANLEDALQEYLQARKLRGKIPQADETDSHFMLLLLRMGKFEELEKAAGTEESLPLRAFLLTAIAAQRGVAAAGQMVRGARLGADDRRTLLMTVAQYSDWARLYPQAKEVYELIAQEEKDATTTKAVVKAYERLRPFEEIEFPADDPRHPVQQLCIGLLVGGKRKEEIARLFTRRSTQPEREETLQIVEKHLRPWRKTDPQHQRQPSSNADVVSMWKMAVSGDKESGHRVLVTGSLLQPLTCYVVFEEEAYRLLPLGIRPANLGAPALDRLAAGDVPGAGQWLSWAWEDLKPQFGWFDPFATYPFAHIWRKAARDRPENVRRAAAALLSEGKQPQAAIPILLEAKKQGLPADQALQVDRALALAYMGSEQPQELLKTAEEMLKDHPRVAELHYCRLKALLDLDRRDEARQGVLSYLEKTSGRSVFEGGIAVLAGMLGEFEVAQKRLRLLADSGKATPGSLHSLAWHAVVCERVDQQALNSALIAVEEAPPEHEGRTLATLAAVCIELGKPAEALEHLGRAADARGGRLESADWYVLGRLAEHYGLDDIAAGLYRKVTPLPKARANDPHALAQRRLKKMGK